VGFGELVTGQVIVADLLGCIISVYSVVRFGLG
jgi:hypothetical protein